MNNKSIFISYNVLAADLETPFITAKGPKRHINLVQVSLSCGDFVGRGETCESISANESVETIISSLRLLDSKKLTITELLFSITKLPSFGARTALDIAYWDLWAKLNDQPAWKLIWGTTDFPQSTLICKTLSLNEELDYTYLLSKQPIKIKVNQNIDFNWIQDIRDHTDSTILLDANESWTQDFLCRSAPILYEIGVNYIEQPLKRGHDKSLSRKKGWPKLIADESFQTIDNYDYVMSRYDAINIKLFKCGGLSPAINICQHARLNNHSYMIGSMIGSYLSIAPALLLTEFSFAADLDGHLWLSDDFKKDLPVKQGYLKLTSKEIWG